MTILDCCVSLKMIKKNLVVLGVVDMRQLLLKLTVCIAKRYSQKQRYYSTQSRTLSRVCSLM